MKILVISNYYPPYYIGGYELSCYDTVEFLKSKGHEVTVLTGIYKKQSDEFEEVYRKLKYIDYSNPSYSNKSEIEKYNYEITKDVINKINPQIVYFWSLRLISLSPIWIVDKLKIKKIFEIGDFWMKGFLNNSFSSTLKRVVKQSIPFSIAKSVKIDPIISVSSWMIDEMKSLYGTKTYWVIPNGTKVSSKHITKEQKVMKFLFAGRVDYTKGLDMAIKALGELRDRKLDSFEFDIYGDGDKAYINKCKKLVQVLNLEDKVFFRGKTDDLQKVYEQAHVLLMPTRMREPFGLVIIEAMNSETLVIAPNAYGPKEIIKDNKTGLLFEMNNQEDLNLKVIKVYKDWKYIDEITKRAKNHIIEKYELNKVKFEVEKVLLQQVKA